MTGRLFVLPLILSVLAAGLQETGPTSQPQESEPCTRPKPVFTPDPTPPDGWFGKGPKTARTTLEMTIDKKGRVLDPKAINSGGKDVDARAIEAVKNWRFVPKTCGKDPVETRMHVLVRIVLR